MIPRGLLGIGEIGNGWTGWSELKIYYGYEISLCDLVLGMAVCTLAVS